MLGIGAAILLVVAAWLIGIKPDKPVQSISAANSVAGQSDGVTIKEAKKGSDLWLLCAMQFFFFGTLITIPTHIVPHSIDSGLTPAVAATILSTIAASSIFGRLLIGGFVDRIGGKRCLNICLFVLLLSLVLLLVLEDNNWLYAFAALYGFAHGGLFTVVSPTVAEYFGMRSHGAIFGVVVFTGTVGGAMLPIITGLIFDKLQSYQWAFSLLAMMVLISFLLSLRLAPRQSQEG